jgi:hypothetical protein
MQHWRKQCHPTELTYFDIIYTGGSTPGVLRRFVYDAALTPDFYQPESQTVLLDARLYSAIQQAINTNDYTDLPAPLVAAKLMGKSELTQIGYAKRQLNSDKIVSMTLVEDARQTKPPEAGTSPEIETAANPPSAIEDFDQMAGDTLATMYEQGYLQHGNAFWAPMLKLVSSMKTRPDSQKVELAQAVLRVVQDDDGETDKAAYGRHMICAHIAHQAMSLSESMRTELMAQVVQVANELYAQHGFEAWDSVKAIANEALSLPGSEERGNMFRALHGLVEATRPSKEREKLILLNSVRNEVSSYLSRNGTSSG